MPPEAATIAAVATAPGTGGVAVIRVSGPEAWAVAAQLFRGKSPLKPGRVHHGWVHDPATGQPVDEVLVLAFRGPASFTGEDVIELHGHGGPVLTRRLLNLCLDHGAAPAPPGEFTRRALLNGKLDLTQAESVMDLIAARSERMLTLAGANLHSRTLDQAITGLATPLMGLQAQIVACVDFPDEVDEPERPPLQAELAGIRQRLAAVMAASNSHRLAREGLRVALVGQPNAGKSSLFNALLATERAIVSDIPGTTRDVLTETLMVAGVAVTLVDTAGIREATADDDASRIEQLGVARSRLAAAEAGAVLLIVDATRGWTPEDADLWEALPAGIPRAIVANKQDLHPTVLDAPGPCLPVSVATGQGIPALTDWLAGVIAHAGGDSDLLVCLNERQTRCLAAVDEALALADVTLADPRHPIDLVTVPLSEALNRLDELMGRHLVEGVLDEVFQRFCVGK